MKHTDYFTKKLTLVLSLIIYFGLINTSIASSINKYWTKQIGTTESDIPLDVAIDSENAVYITGRTEGNFGLNRNNGSWDIFLLKLNSQGKKAWVKQIGTPGMDEASRIIIDTDDNVYIAGFIEGTFNNQKHAGEYDVFIAKFNSEGALLWSKSVGTDDYDVAYDLDIDKAGNVYITGYVNSSFFDNVKSGKTSHFIMKLSSIGKLDWVKKIHDAAGFISITSNGNTLIAGGEDSNLLVAEYDSRLNTIWRSKGHTYWYLNGMDKDSNGHIYITGGTTEPKLYITKYSNKGKYLWSKALGNAKGSTVGTSISVNRNNQIFVAGFTDHKTDRKRHLGDDDIIILGYNAKGKRIYADQFGTAEQDRAYGIIFDKKGDLYLIGHTAGELNNKNIGSDDIFIVKYKHITMP